MNVFELFNAVGYENLSLLRTICQASPMSEAEKAKILTAPMNLDAAAVQQHLAVENMLPFEVKFADGGQCALKIVLEYNYDFRAALDSAYSQHKYDKVVLNDFEDYLEIIGLVEVYPFEDEPTTPLPYGVAKIFRDGRDENLKFIKECNQRRWCVQIERLEHLGFDKVEGANFLKSKAQWKWERLRRDRAATLELVRNTLIPTSVFQDLAHAKSNRAFEKRAGNWGVEMDNTHPRRTAWAELIVDMRGGR